MDWVHNCGLGAEMEDTEELVSRLCTHAGMIMEDASVVALTIGVIPAPQRAAALEELLKSAVAINCLVEAALAVSR